MEHLTVCRLVLHAATLYAAKSSAHRRPSCALLERLAQAVAQARDVPLDAQCAGYGELSVLRIFKERFNLPTGCFQGLISVALYPVKL